MRRICCTAVKDAHPTSISALLPIPTSSPRAWFPCKVNLWAVARQGLEPPNTRRGGAPRLRQAQAPVGFEHALSVDLAELVGAKNEMGKGGGAKHIALFGNLLAVATDHAVFLVHLSFDVKGEEQNANNWARAHALPVSASWTGTVFV